MSERKFTHGPWLVDPTYCHDIQSESGLEIAAALSASEVGKEWKITGPCPPDDEAVANARLIASAPELLEALTKLLDGTERLVDEIVSQRDAITHPGGRRAHFIDSADSERVDALNAVLATYEDHAPSARAAIAKATGQ